MWDNIGCSSWFKRTCTKGIQTQKHTLWNGDDLPLCQREVAHVPETEKHGAMLKLSTQVIARRECQHKTHCLVPQDNRQEPTIPQSLQWRVTLQWPMARQRNTIHFSATRHIWQRSTKISCFFLSLFTIGQPFPLFAYFWHRLECHTTQEDQEALWVYMATSSNPFDAIRDSFQPRLHKLLEKHPAKYIKDKYIGKPWRTTNLGGIYGSFNQTKTSAL